MSIATVHFIHSTPGWNFTTQTLPKITDNRICTAQCSEWGTSVAQGPKSAPSLSSGTKFSGRSNALVSEWTGSDSRFVLHTASSLKGGNNPTKVLARCRHPMGGLIHLRTLCKAGRVNPYPVHHMYSTAPRRCSYLPSSVFDGRLAYGYYLGPAYGYGGGFGNGSLLVFIVLGFIAVQAFQSLASGPSEGGLTRTPEKVSVLKLQVGLLGFARTLQNNLERISDLADTSTSRGLHYILTETVLTLLRQPDMCILGTSLVIFMKPKPNASEVKRSVEAGERRFNQLSLEERGKFDEETLVNVDGNRKWGQDKMRVDGFSNEYIVVTLLVAAEGDYYLPAIYDNNDLKEALKRLGSIPADNVQGVEILWTPQDKGDSLSERDLLRNYPLLKSL